MKLPQKGFTLVEMVISLTLTGLIVAVLGGALFGLGQGFAKSTERAIQVETIFHVSNAIRASLLRVKSSVVDNTVHLRGREDSVLWHATMPDSSPMIGSQQLSLIRLNQYLILRVDDALRVNPSLDKMLLSDINHFELEYQRRTDGVWGKTWEEKSLPLRIRVNIHTQHDGVWPPLVVLFEN